MFQALSIGESQVDQHKEDRSAMLLTAEHLSGEESGVLGHIKSLSQHNKKLYRENMKLVQQLKQANQLLENMQEKCARIQEEADTSKALYGDMQQEGKCCDSILIKLQDK